MRCRSDTVITFQRTIDEARRPARPTTSTGTEAVSAGTDRARSGRAGSEMSRRAPAPEPALEPLDERRRRASDPMAMARQEEPEAGLAEAHRARVDGVEREDRELRRRRRGWRCRRRCASVRSTRWPTR